MIKTIETKAAPAAVGPYSQAKQIGDFVYLSGQIPVNPATGLLEGTDISSQTKQVIANISAVLAEAGLTAENVIKTTCFLAEIADFAAFNEVYASYFTGKPARSCIAVKDIPKGALVEIEVIAHNDK